MIRLTGKGPDGEDTLFLGLTVADLDKLRSMPLRGNIRLERSETGLPCDIVIFSGRTEDEMLRALAKAPRMTLGVAKRLRN